MPLTRRTFLLTAGSAALAACSHAAHRVATRRPPVRVPRTTTTAPTGLDATTAPSSAPARFIRSGTGDARAVALTFHGSGDVGLATELLDAAHTAGVALTIFAVGRWLDENPDMARRVLDGGHELANHTYTHPSLGRLGATTVADEIVRCRDALTRHAGVPGRWFRPSGVDVATPLMLSEAGRAGYSTVVGYDVDPHDYEDPGASQIVARVRAGLRPGAIVSLHTGHSGTVTALPGILDAVAAARLQAVTVHQLLDR
jgi:peptidoglycan/xylan/chitin deacetylase (PgdA/CDA1 family)